MHWSPPNILRSSVVGWAQKLEESKKNRCRQGIFCWKRAFCCEERVIYDIWYNKDTENLKRESQNQKKGHQNFWAWKWTFFPEKFAKIFCVPQTRRQVTAHAFTPTQLLGSTRPGCPLSLRLCVSLSRFGFTTAFERTFTEKLLSQMMLMGYLLFDFRDAIKIVGLVCWGWSLSQRPLRPPTTAWGYSI